MDTSEEGGGQSRSLPEAVLWDMDDRAVAILCIRMH